MKPVIVLFDLDGTLVDTEPLAAQAIVDCYVPWLGSGVVTLQEAEFCIGRTWANALKHLFKKFPPPVSFEDGMVTILRRYRALLDEAEGASLEVKGARDAVAMFANNPHVHLGLVSGSNREDILWNLGKLQIAHHFKIILGAEDYGNSKPSPEGYLKAIRHFLAEIKAKDAGAEPAPVLIFEDSEAGIESALNAKAKVVAIGRRQSHRPVLTYFPDLRGVTQTWFDSIQAKLFV